MLTKASLNLAKLAPNEDSRCTLKGILVTPDESVVTDGHMMVVINNIWHRPEELPGIPNGTATIDFKPFVLEAKDALQVASTIAKKSTVPMLQQRFVTPPNNDGFVTIGCASEQALTVKPMAGNFPDFKRVLPGKDPVFRFNVGAKLLKRVVDYAAQNGDERGAVLEFGFHASDGKLTNKTAMEIRATVGDGQDMRALIMPMRHDRAGYCDPIVIQSSTKEDVDAAETIFGWASNPAFEAAGKLLEVVSVALSANIDLAKVDPAALVRLAAMLDGKRPNEANTETNAPMEAHVETNAVEESAAVAA